MYRCCSGAQIKTRKRNIAVPLDPASFADAVVEIFQDSKEGDDLDKNLQAAVKASADLSLTGFFAREVIEHLIAEWTGTRRSRIGLFAVWRDSV